MNRAALVALALVLSVSATTAELDPYASPLADMRREQGMVMGHAPIGSHEVEPSRRRRASQIAEAAYRAVIRDMVASEAARQGVPANLAVAVAKQESGFNPAAVSYQGARGVMQVMPGTARILGHTGSVRDLHDAATNIRLGVAYLRQGLDEGGPSWAVRRYHGGPNTRMHGRKNAHYHRVVMASAGYAVAASAHRARPDAQGWLARGTTAALEAGRDGTVDPQPHGPCPRPTPR